MVYNASPANGRMLAAGIAVRTGACCGLRPTGPSPPAHRARPDIHIPCGSGPSRHRARPGQGAPPPEAPGMMTAPAVPKRGNSYLRSVGGPGRSRSINVSRLAGLVASGAGSTARPAPRPGPSLAERKIHRRLTRPPIAPGEEVSDLIRSALRDRRRTCIPIRLLRISHPDVRRRRRLSVCHRSLDDGVTGLTADAGPGSCRTTVLLHLR